jgi:hypothetical protein
MDDSRWSEVFALVDWHKLLLGNDGRLQWETLVTGVLAIASAMLTIWFLNLQIRHADANAKDQRDQTDKLAKEQRARRARAARAMLPAALEELADYATACVAGLWGLRPYFPGDGWLNLSQADKPPPRWAPSALTEHVLSVIRECLEFFDPVPRGPPGPGDPPGPADALADLMRRFHSQNYFARSLATTISGPDRGSQLSWNYMKDVIVDSAELHALARRLAWDIDNGNFTASSIDFQDALFAARCFDGADADEAGKLLEQWERRPKWHRTAGATRKDD